MTTISTQAPRVPSIEPRQQLSPAAAGGTLGGALGGVAFGGITAAFMQAEAASGGPTKGAALTIAKGAGVGIVVGGLVGLALGAGVDALNGADGVAESDPG